MKKDEILYAIRKYGRIISIESINHKRVTKVELLNLTKEERELFMNSEFQCKSCISCCGTDEIPCDYLSENNQCLIYNDRPLACELFPIKISGVKIGNAARVFWIDGRVELEIDAGDYLSVVFDEKCKGWGTGKPIEKLIHTAKGIIINSGEMRQYLTPPEYSEKTEVKAKYFLKNIRKVYGRVD